MEHYLKYPIVRISFCHIKFIFIILFIAKSYQENGVHTFTNYSLYQQISTFSKSDGI